MQIRKETIIFVFASALAVLLYFLGYKVDIMPDWLIYSGIAVCLLAIFGSILALTPFGEKLLKKKPIQTLTTDSVNAHPTDTYSNVVRIKVQEPSKYPPMIVSIVLVIFGLIMLASGIWLTYLAVAGNVIPQALDFNWLIFFLLFIAFPIWILVDTIFIDPRQRKLGKSRVAKEKTIDLVSDVDSMFDRCLRAISTRKHSIINMERPKLIKARWHDYIMTVTVTNMGHGRIRVHIFGDSKWTTTKWDFGTNQRNIDALERLIRS